MRTFLLHKNGEIIGHIQTNDPSYIPSSDSYEVMEDINFEQAKEKYKIVLDQKINKSLLIKK